MLKRSHRSDLSLVDLALPKKNRVEVSTTLLCARLESNQHSRETEGFLVEHLSTALRFQGPCFPSVFFTLLPQVPCVCLFRHERIKVRLYRTYFSSAYQSPNTWRLKVFSSSPQRKIYSILTSLPSITFSSDADFIALNICSVSRVALLSHLS